MTDIPVLTFITKTGSGKTTLMEKLIAEFKRRGGAFPLALPWRL
jgi:molybdopterin-guanine dinucleotide biosynthesis protein